MYNYEYINSSSSINDKSRLNSIIFYHIQRVIFDFNIKKINEITSFDLVAYILSNLIQNKLNDRYLDYVIFIVEYQIDKIGVHKSYNLLEHAKFINNLNELKNILLFFKFTKANRFDDIILKMTSILNQYFHHDGSLPLFNGSNNIYTSMINDSVNKDIILKKGF